MKKSIEIRIFQKPVEVGFTCAYCDEELEIDYEEFVEMTNSDLCEILYDEPDFKCPKCDGKLYVGQTDLD